MEKNLITEMKFMMQRLENPRMTYTEYEKKHNNINEFFGKKTPKNSDDMDDPNAIRIEEAPDLVAIPNYDKSNVPGRQLIYVVRDTLKRFNPYLIYSTIDGYIMSSKPFEKVPVNSLKDAMIQIQGKLDKYMEGEPERNRQRDKFYKERFGLGPAE